VLLAVCVSGEHLYRLPNRPSGIDKRPVAGRVAVHPLGLDGDVREKGPPAPHRTRTPSSSPLAGSG
jgi:MOSC domain-containing protein YiiM